MLTTLSLSEADGERMSYQQQQHEHNMKHQDRELMIVKFAEDFRFFQKPAGTTSAPVKLNAATQLAEPAPPVRAITPATRGSIH